jgi:hypothetical protein
MKFLQSGLVLMAGVLGAATATGYTDVDATKMHRKPDIREAILRRFLSANHSPVESYAGNFILEADAHHLDWRLLPSLAWIESGAGQRNRLNNIFGWANGASRFSTASEAIHHVAEALAEARAYKGKDLSAKLAAYNPAPGYRGLVTTVMAQISRLPEPKSFEEAFASKSWRIGSCHPVGSL